MQIEAPREEPVPAGRSGVAQSYLRFILTELEVDPTPLVLLSNRSFPPLNSLFLNVSISLSPAVIRLDRRQDVKMKCVVCRACGNKQIDDGV